MHPIYQTSNKLISDNKNNINPLQELFNAAHAGKWEEVFIEISKKPSLLNETLKGSINETILLIASSHVAEGREAGKALEFIKECLDNKWDLNIDISPVDGPDQGKSVFWNLVFSAVLFEGGEVDDSYHEKISIISQLIKTYPACHLNAAPKTGIYQGITAFQLGLRLDDPEICDPILNSAAPISDSVVKLSSEPEIYISTLLMLTSWMEYDPPQPKGAHSHNGRCSYHILKMLEHAPLCNVNFKYASPEGSEHPSNPLEFVLKLPPSPERRKVLLYLILLGAKLSDTAKENWKIEAESLQQELKSVFNSAHTVWVSKLSLEPQYEILPELKFNIVFNMIYRSFPELETFPPKVLAQRLFEKEWK